MKLITNLIILTFLSQMFACAKMPNVAEQNEFNFFVGTGTGEKSEGIYAYSLNPSTGVSTFKSKRDGIINPTFLAISPDNKHLYAIEKEEGSRKDMVSAFAIDDGLNLKLLNSQPTNGKGSCYLSISNTGDNVMVAHYSNGSLAVLPVKEDGSLEQVSDLVQHEGSSVDMERQKGPHAHYIAQGLGDLVYAADLGTDKVMIYELENNKLKSSKTEFLQAAPGNGPRHISYHPNQKFLYLMNEMGGSVSVFSFDKANSTFELIQTISSLPTGFSDYNKSADIHVHPSGKFLYASNRGDHNSIAAYKIDQSNGTLTLVEIENETIVWPRNFAISPDGKFLLSANMKDDTISVFSIDQESGALDFTGYKIAVPKPMCIKFLS